MSAVVTEASRFGARHEVEHFFEGMAWLGQIVLASKSLWL
jgi:NhaP-type Na+/H+ and K+/H+ antiporter